MNKEDYIDLTGIPLRVHKKTLRAKVKETVRRLYGQEFSIHQLLTVIEKQTGYKDRANLYESVRQEVYHMHGIGDLVKLQKADKDRYHGNTSMWREA